MRYIFGDYVLDTQRHELRHGGELVKLRRKVFQVLVYLLAHRDRVVSKQELLDHLWPDQFVGEATLTSCIKTLRKALGEQGRAPRFLRTLHSQGYRLVAAVEERDHDPTDAAADVLPIQRREIATPQSEGLPPPLSSSFADSTILPYEAPEAEHKQVTILCGALADAPTLSACLGPEVMHHVMHDVLAQAQDTVQRYGGTLAQVSSDGFMALFGAPVAQEDHARGAVLAALELSHRLHMPNTIRGQPHGVAVRLGLHSGPVVVGPLVHDPQRPYSAVGDTLQLAMQLQEQTVPETLLASASTYALVQDEVLGEACEALSLGGSSPPVPVYAVRGLLRRRAGVPRRAARPLNRFVGRTQELALLLARLEQAARGQGQVVGLAGEPGLGKSRLLAEFVHSLRGRPVTCCEAHCLGYGSATPYLPMRDLLRQLWNLPEQAEAPRITATVRQRLREAGVASEDEASMLLRLLDMPMDQAASPAHDPRTHEARTFAVLRHIIRHASRQQPLMLAVENLHWIDPTSEEWLTSLVECLGDTPVLLVVTYRPGYHPPWSRHSATTQVALPRLSRRDSLMVLQSMPQAAQFSMPVQEAIVARASGNPFFVEELIQALVEHGGDDCTLPMPDTIEAVLGARIDRLPLVEKHLLQTAAVFGNEVPVPLLQELAGLPEDTLLRALADLQGGEFLYETHPFPDQTYTFKHALTREVAYGSLLHERRRALHRWTVGALEALYPDRPGQSVEYLAQHALRGELWEKAVLYCRQAGEKARARGAFREAMTGYEQALDALGHLPEHLDTGALAIELNHRVGAMLSLVGEHQRSLTLLGEAEARARQLDDRARLGMTLSRMVTVRRIVGDVEGAMATGLQTLELAAKLEDPVLKVDASYRLGQVYTSVGDYIRAAEVLRGNVMALAEAMPGKMRLWCIKSQAWLAEVLSQLGEFAEGRHHGEEALRLAGVDGQWQGDAPIMNRARLGWLYLAQGSMEDAIRVLDEGLALCRGTGQRASLGPIAGGLGEAYAQTGRVAEGLALLEEAYQDDLRTGRLGSSHGTHLRQLSVVYLLAGHVDKAWQYASQALDLARALKVRGHEAQALCQLGAVQAQTNPADIPQAEAHYQEALTQAEALGMRPLQAHCHRGLGTLYAKTGRQAQACTALATAIEFYCAMEMTFWLPQAKAALVEVARCAESIPADVDGLCDI